MSKTNWIKRAVSRMLIAAMVLSTVVTNSLVGFAAIAATDHFTLTAAGDGPRWMQEGLWFLLSKLTMGQIPRKLL
jgi:hypothetical protein